MKQRGVLTLGLFALFLLSGCAHQQADNGSPETRQSREENLSARLHTELGASYFARGQYAVALQELRAALTADNAYAPAYSILGLVHAELREDKQAEEHFKHSIELSPQYSEAHNNFGLFLCQHGRMQEGLQHFEVALNNPLYATPEKALVNAGNCAVEKNDLEQAERYFVRALKRAPNLASALLGMAEIHYRQGRWLAARTVLRQFSAQFNEGVDSQMPLGAQALWLGVRVERRLQDREAEGRYGSQLRRRYPESMQAQWLLSEQYDQAGSLL